MCVHRFACAHFLLHCSWCYFKTHTEYTHAYKILQYTSVTKLSSSLHLDSTLSGFMYTRISAMIPYSPNTHTHTMAIRCDRAIATNTQFHYAIVLLSIFCVDPVWHPMYWFHWIFYLLHKTEIICFCLLASHPVWMYCGSNIKLVSFSKLPAYTILSSTLCDNIWR